VTDRSVRVGSMLHSLSVSYDGIRTSAVSEVSAPSNRQRSD
jgi:hypothetical protein